MTGVTVKIDQQMLQDVQQKLGNLSKKAPNVMANSLNRALSNVATNMSKEVRKEYTIKAADIKETLIKSRASKSNLRAVVESKGELIPLDKFKVSPRTVQPRRKSPIKVGVKKGGVKPILHAFVADVNGIKVFERKGEARFPIRKLFGPSVPQMLANEQVREQINHEGNVTFLRRLDHEIHRILEKGSASS